jgi:hypothetical protein
MIDRIESDSRMNSSKTVSVVLACWGDWIFISDQKFGRVYQNRFHKPAGRHPGPVSRISAAPSSGRLPAFWHPAFNQRRLFLASFFNCRQIFAQKPVVFPDRPKPWI